MIEQPVEPVMPDKPDKPPESFPSNIWPLLVVLLVVVAGVVYAYFGFWRRASVSVAGAMAIAGVLRLVLSRETAGLLVVRRRVFDVAVYLLLAVSIAVVAFVVPPAR